MAALESLSFIFFSDVVKLLNPLHGIHGRSTTWEVGVLRLPVVSSLLV